VVCCTPSCSRREEEEEDVMMGGARQWALTSDRCRFKPWLQIANLWEPP